jgi:hypothetical protein
MTRCGFGGSRRANAVRLHRPTGWAKRLVRPRWPAREGDDWLPEEPATAAAYELLPEWVRWSGEQAGIPGPLVERSVAIAERRQSDTSDCPSFRFRPRPGGAT